MTTSLRNSRNRQHQRALQLESLEPRQLMASFSAEASLLRSSQLAAVDRVVQTPAVSLVARGAADVLSRVERFIDLSSRSGRTPELLQTVASIRNQLRDQHVPMDETVGDRRLFGDGAVGGGVTARPIDGLIGLTPNPFPHGAPLDLPSLLPPRPSVDDFVPSSLEDLLSEAGRGRDGADRNTSQVPVPEQPPELYHTDVSFRLGTYNFQAFPIDGLNPTINFMSLEDRAQKLADRIRKSNYDVIALQEVWDDDAKEVLVRELSTRDGETGDDRYPYVVAKLANPLGVDGIPLVDEVPNVLDSGLMLFSKMPFDAIPVDGHPTAPDTRVLVGNELSSENVAFTEFADTEAAADEQGATKGAGYVRVYHAAADKHYNIVFTHMLNGSYNKVKGPAFDKIREMLESYGPGNLDEGEEIFIVGDLNMNGDIQERKLSREITPRDIAEFDGDGVKRDRRFYNGPPEGDEEPEPDTDQAYLDMVSRLTVDGMSIRDAWARDNPYFDAFDNDRGTTDPAYKPWDNDAPTPWFEPTLLEDMHGDHAIPTDSGDRDPNNRQEPKRIDYIFYLHPESWNDDETLAFQQLQLAYNLYHNGQTLSDHIGLTADLNRRVEHGYAADSQQVDSDSFDNEWSTAQLSGWIVQPNGSQWFSLRGGGTYTFGYDPRLVPNVPSQELAAPWQTPPRSEDDPREGNFRLEVFNARDLSRPISPYHMDGESDKYHLADGENYLVRVSHVDRQFVGHFELAAHRHTGRFDDMRTLLPNEPSRHVAKTEGAAWFQIDTDTPFADDGVQTLTFRTDRPADFALSVFQAVGSGRQRISNLTSHADGSLTWTDPRANGTRLYLAVAPRNADVEATFEVEWETNLTVAEPLVLGAQSLTPDDFDIADIFDFTVQLTTTGLGGVLAGPAGAVGGAVLGDIVGQFVTDGIGTVEQLLGTESDEDVRMTLMVDQQPLFGEDTVLLPGPFGGHTALTFPKSIKLGDFRLGWHGDTSHKSLPAWHEELAQPIAYLDAVEVGLSVDDTLDDDDLEGVMPGLAADQARWMGYLTEVRGDGGVYHFYANLHHGTHRLGDATSIYVWAETDTGDSAPAAGSAFEPVVASHAESPRSPGSDSKLDVVIHNAHIEPIELARMNPVQTTAGPKATGPAERVAALYQPIDLVTMSPVETTAGPKAAGPDEPVAVLHQPFVPARLDPVKTTAVPKATEPVKLLAVSDCAPPVLMTTAQSRRSLLVDQLFARHPEETSMALDTSWDFDWLVRE